MEEPLISIPRNELEALLNRAAEKGANRALAMVGLEGEQAAADIRDLRCLLQAITLAKRTAWQTFIRLFTTGIILMFILGVMIRFRFFGGH